MTEIQIGYAMNSLVNDKDLIKLKNIKEKKDNEIIKLRNILHELEIKHDELK